MVYQKSSATKIVPVSLPDGSMLKLSHDRQGELQSAVIETFVPRFAPNARLLYLGDVAKKTSYQDADRLAQLSVSFDEHDTPPAIVLYDEMRRWLFLIETAASPGLMTPQRVAELGKMFASSFAGCIYISVFPDLDEFGKYIEKLAWETEAWIAEIPEHLIHFNGDRFLGPR